MSTDKDLRSHATDLLMDLSRDTVTIHLDLKDRWPRESIWWELEPGEKTGWVYGDKDRILVKLVHFREGSGE